MCTTAKYRVFRRKFVCFELVMWPEFWILGQVIKLLGARVVKIYTRLTILLFFTSCNLDTLTLNSVKIQIVFSVKQEQKQQFFLIQEVLCVPKNLFYAYLTSFYQINVVCHLWSNLEKKILSVATVKSGYKDETKLFSTEKYFEALPPILFS